MPPTHRTTSTRTGCLGLPSLAPPPTTPRPHHPGHWYQDSTPCPNDPMGLHSANGKGQCMDCGAQQ
jgi:hypothetical protein